MNYGQLMLLMYILMVSWFYSFNIPMDTCFSPILWKPWIYMVNSRHDEYVDDYIDFNYVIASLIYLDYELVVYSFVI